MYRKLELTSMQRPLRKRRAGQSSLVDSWPSTIWDSSHALKVHEQEIQDSFLQLLWTIGGQSIKVGCDRNQKVIHAHNTYMFGKNVKYATFQEMFEPVITKP